MTITQHTFSTLAIYMLLAMPLFSRSYDQEYLTKINEQHLKSFGINLEIDKLVEPPFQSLTEQLKYTFSTKLLSLPILSTQELRHSALRACKQNIYGNNSLINLHLAHKMGLIHGTGTNSGDHLAFRLSTIADTENKLTSLIHTEIGKAFFIQKISQPHTDITQLIKGQRIINTCVENNQLHTMLAEILKTMGKNETHLLSYYSDKDIVHTWAAQLKRSYYWRLPLLTRLNNSAYGLELNMILTNIFKLLDAPAQVGLVRFALKVGYDKVNIKYDKSVQLITNLSTVYNSYKVAPSMLNHLSEIKLMIDVNNMLQKHLMGIAHYLNEAKQLYRLLHQHPEITKNFSALHELEALIKPSQKHSAEFNEFTQLLSTNTFKGEASFFSIIGRVLRAHALMSMKSVQEEFTGIINAIGELDTYVALARKIRATADKEIKYSLVTFDTTSNIPYLKAIDLWNPFVYETQAITNTIEMGGTHPRNIILSGPNTGGKSTLSKAVLLNTILAQTFGIAAAQSMTITPFDNIDCYLNMIDDTASGVSGLKAEVNRAKEIIAKLRNTTGFSLILLDEIFTATSPQQAEKLAVSFIAKLTEQANCLFINAAHFEGIVQFAEQSHHCKNYHMGVILDHQGKVLKYTYKLAQGRSTIKNAEQIAEEILIDW